MAGCLDAWIPKGRRAQGLFDPLALEIDEPVGREVEAMAGDRRTFYVAATRARRRVIFTVSSVAFHHQHCLGEHRAVYDAICARDPAAAHTAVQQLLRGAEADMRTTLSR